MAAASLPRGAVRSSKSRLLTVKKAFLCYKDWSKRQIDNIVLNYTGHHLVKHMSMSVILHYLLNFLQRMRYTDQTKKDTSLVQDIVIISICILEGDVSSYCHLIFGSEMIVVKNVEFIDLIIVICHYSALHSWYNKEFLKKSTNIHQIRTKNEEGVHFLIHVKKSVSCICIIGTRSRYFLIYVTCFHIDNNIGLCLVSMTTNYDHTLIVLSSCCGQNVRI